MEKKQNILVLCGGQSTEHDISILSAQNVVQQLDLDKYDVAVVIILQDGRWFHFNTVAHFLDQDFPLSSMPTQGSQLYCVPGAPEPFHRADDVSLPKIDCVLPILHGANGEDGVMQGFLEVMNLPYVGADVLGAAIAMDKDITKQLLARANLPVVDWLLLTQHDAEEISFAAVVQQLGSPFFVKANSLGSSIGVYKVSDEAGFDAALESAFSFDERVLLEKAIVGREIECSVLGNKKPVSSLPGEIINHTDFYSFTAKYEDKNAASVETPAELPASVVKIIRKLSIQAVRALRCEGMARVDFFLTKDNALYINEINAIPGFTDISMYPKNWEVSGLSQVKLFDELIQLGQSRFKQKHALIRDMHQYAEQSTTSTL